MDIKSTSQKHIDPYAQQVQKKGLTAAEQRGQEVAQPAAKGDTVSVSPQAKLLTVASSSISSAPEVRQERIDELKEQVNNGSYQIDSKKIAERMLSSEIELGKSLGS